MKSNLEKVKKVYDITGERFYLDAANKMLDNLLQMAPAQ